MTIRSPNFSVSIHAPRAGRDCKVSNCSNSGTSFNPRAPCGARLDFYAHDFTLNMFQSTRPMRGATTSMISWTSSKSLFQSTRPMRGATAFAILKKDGIEFQSTRPMRGATFLGRLDMEKKEFQSTRPVWGATPCPRRGASTQDVSIHAPRVGRDSPLIRPSPCWRVSIHAPRVGRDLPLIYTDKGVHEFQSTRPVWGATSCRSASYPTSVVSIHAPHAGRDADRDAASAHPCSFNPRAPCGARRGVVPHSADFYRFQSTRPMRGATGAYCTGAGKEGVSIHAPRVGRDRGGRSTPS